MSLHLGRWPPTAPRLGHEELQRALLLSLRLSLCFSVSPDSNSKVQQGLLPTSGTSRSPGASPESASSPGLGAMRLNGGHPVSGKGSWKTTVVPQGVGSSGQLRARDGPVTFSSSQHSHHQSPLVLLQVQVLQQRDLHQRSLFRELIWNHCLPAAAASQSQPGKPARRPLARGARVDPCPPPGASAPPVAAGGAPSALWRSRPAVGHLGEGGSPIHREPAQSKMTRLMFRST